MAIRGKAATRWRPVVISPRKALTGEVCGALAEAAQVAAVQVDSYPRAGTLGEIMASHRPNLWLIDVGADPGKAVALIAEAAALKPRPSVVAVHTASDPDLIMRCLRQGATEFLQRPFDTGTVGESLERLARLRGPEHDPAAGKVYCVMPGKGACGASTLATNLAVQFKRLEDGRLLLADLDPVTGTTSFLLNIRSNYSFVDALMHAHDLDDDIWKGLVTSYQGLDVLLSPENPADAVMDPPDPGALVDYMRSNYATVVLDARAPHGSWNLGLARECDELLMVTTNELPALHCTRRAITYLDQNGVEASKIRLIVNRYSPHVGLSREAIETALHCDVFHVLPSDYEAVQKALMEGRALGSGSALGKSLIELAARLRGRQPEARKTSLLSGLFSLFDTASTKA